MWEFNCVFSLHQWVKLVHVSCISQRLSHQVNTKWLKFLKKLVSGPGVKIILSPQASGMFRYHVDAALCWYENCSSSFQDVPLDSGLWLGPSIATVIQKCFISVRWYSTDSEQILCPSLANTTHWDISPLQDFGWPQQLHSWDQTLASNSSFTLENKFKDGLSLTHEPNMLRQCTWDKMIVSNELYWIILIIIRPQEACPWRAWSIFLHLLLLMRQCPSVLKAMIKCGQ